MRKYLLSKSTIIILPTIFTSIFYLLIENSILKIDGINALDASQISLVVVALNIIIGILFLAREGNSNK